MSVKLKIQKWEYGKNIAIEVDSEMVDHKVHGLSCFIHKSINVEGCWTISEFTTGACMCESGTIQDAIEEIDRLAIVKGKKEFQRAVKELRTKYGIVNKKLPQPTL